MFVIQLQWYVNVYKRLIVAYIYELWVMVERHRHKTKKRTMTRRIIKTEKRTDKERFNFCLTRFFLFFCLHSIGTFVFCRHSSLRFTKPKEPIFAQLTETINYI